MFFKLSIEKTIESFYIFVFYVKDFQKCPVLKNRSDYKNKIVTTFENVEKFV